MSDCWADVNGVPLGKGPRIAWRISHKGGMMGEDYSWSDRIAYLAANTALLEVEYKRLKRERRGVVMIQLKSVDGAIWVNPNHVVSLEPVPGKVEIKWEKQGGDPAAESILTLSTGYRYALTEDYRNVLFKMQTEEYA